MIAAVIVLAVALAGVVGALVALLAKLSSTMDNLDLADRATASAVFDRDRLQMRVDLLTARIAPLETRLSAAEIARNESYRKALDDTAALVRTSGIADAGRLVDSILSRALSSLPAADSASSGDRGAAPASVQAPSDP